LGGAPLSLGSAEPAGPAGPPYLLDTHIWIWHVAGSDRLPLGLREAIDAASGELWLSPISVWEAGMLHARGRVELEGGPRPWLERALRRFPLGEAVLSREVALRSHEVHLEHRDPADRLLAATALVHDLTLVTLDERLASAPGLRTRSA
jgi:PIN domain nuclease of toxin-antitoxin system